MNEYIPVNQPVLNGNEKKYLVECIDTGWISSEGPYVKKFEDDFAFKMGRKHAIAVVNGTAAIDVAIEALDISSGDEVIVPAFTIISCLLQIIRVGAKPVLVDSDLSNWNMDVSQIESKITNKTKAIMIVHIYGLPVNVDPVIKLCEKYNLRLIEDAAEMIGQTYHGKMCGSFGDLSTVSFYPNKHITTGEGGMILTDNDYLAEQCRDLRNLCFKQGKRFVHERLGWNLRMTNLQAAVGVAQLEKLDEFVEKKRWIGRLYNELFSNSLDSYCHLPLEKTSYAENIYWVYGIVMKDSIDIDAEEAINRLAKIGIGCRPFFYPMHLQPVLREMSLFQNESYPNSERMYEKGFYIPSGLGLTESQIIKVAGAVKNLFAE